MRHIGNKIWSLPKTEASESTLAFSLAKTLVRDEWSLGDIYQVSQMIEQEPVIKEVIIDLLDIIEGGQ